MDIRSVLRFEGNKPHMGEYVIATTNRGVRSWNTSYDKSEIIGYRIPEHNNVELADDEILILVTGCVYKGHRSSD